MTPKPNRHPLQTVENYPDVPLGAKKLGCRNCRTGDRSRHPQLGLVYCASCPVTYRRMAQGKPLSVATGDAAPVHCREGIHA